MKNAIKVVFLGVLLQCPQALGATFEDVSFEPLVSMFEGNGKPGPKMLDSVTQNYCNDLPEKKEKLHELLTLLEDNYSRLRVGSMAAYEIVDETFNAPPLSVRTERWRVIEKTASGVTISIIDGTTGVLSKRSFLKDAFVPAAFFDDKRPMSCLIVENFFGYLRGGTLRLDGHDLAVMSYSRSGLGGIAGNETVAKNVPFSTVHSDILVSSQPTSKFRQTKLLDFQW